MIEIQKSATADTRTCDWSKVTKDQLRVSSEQHIGDVRKAIDFFKARLADSANDHDSDKLIDLNGFHGDFQTGFKRTDWWDTHRKITRHHLTSQDGIPDDVNLIDVLEMIADCVMAGMGRTGSVYPLEIAPEVLKRAFDNTVDQLKKEIVVKD